MSQAMQVMQQSATCSVREREREERKEGRERVFV